MLAALSLDTGRDDIIDLPTPELQRPLASPARAVPAVPSDDELMFVATLQAKAAPSRALA